MSYSFKNKKEETFIENWRGNMEQTEDLLVSGIKIKKKKNNNS